MIDRTDCFARRKSVETLKGQAECSALFSKSCENCKFYKNNITRKSIERDIQNYYSVKGIHKNEY